MTKLTSVLSQVDTCQVESLTFPVFSDKGDIRRMMFTSEVSVVK